MAGFFFASTLSFWAAYFCYYPEKIFHLVSKEEFCSAQMDFFFFSWFGFPDEISGVFFGLAIVLVCGHQTTEKAVI